MRRLLSCLILLFSLICFCSISCNKDKNKNPVDELPAETETGANTFGCLVDGNIFKPGGAQLSGGPLQCNYQFLEGGYYFVMIGRFRNNSIGSGSSVGLYTDSLIIQEGLKYNLHSRKKGNSSSSYSWYTSSSTLTTYQTDDNSQSGELWIKKLDTINQIVSGTFWFDVIDTTTQKIIEIREGRFDMRYTR